MTLYEIDQAILACVSEIDEETGELLDPDALDALQIEKEKKIESVALWIKNILADINAISAEIEALENRKKRLTNKVNSLKKYLSSALFGEKFSTAKCVVSWTKSETTEFDDPKDYTGIPKKFMVKNVSFKPDKAAIKKAIKSGVKVKGAFLQEHLNMQIK